MKHRSDVSTLTACHICTFAIEKGGSIRWRGNDFHPRCLVAAALLVGDPGGPERVEIADLLAPASGYELYLASLTA